MIDNAGYPIFNEYQQLVFMRSIYLASCVVLFVACNNPSQKPVKNETAAQSWVFGSFTKADEANPVLLPDSVPVFNCPVRNSEVNWEQKDVFNPAAVVRQDTLFLLYRAEDIVGKFAGTSRIGLAWSLDGLTFKRHPVPVLYPDNDSLKKYEWEGGCEDPRIIEDGKGNYFLTYTAYDGDKARLLVASSANLYHWTKHGPAFKTSHDGRYVNEWSKSGSIVSIYENEKIVATKINGKYWMYWGDTDIFLASSDDLINWAPVQSSDGKLLSIFGPRKGMFDSDLVEPGPAAMLTDKGILLIYNSRNVPSKGDTALAEGTYTVSQILLDKNDPSKVTDRMNTYFMKPEKDYEINGQVNRVCFAEGLVNYKHKWFLYYGTADSKIAVAVKE
jgi:predicted GH43/DUF377 family glycosyl hydrolase